VFLVPLFPQLMKLSSFFFLFYISLSSKLFLIELISDNGDRWWYLLVIIFDEVIWKCAFSSHSGCLFLSNLVFFVYIFVGVLFQSEKQLICAFHCVFCRLESNSINMVNFFRIVRQLSLYCIQFNILQSLLIVFNTQRCNYFIWLLKLWFQISYLRL